MNSRTKKVIKGILKFAASGIMLVVALQYIDWLATKSLIGSVNWMWVLVASLFFLCSKIVSSFRLTIFFQRIELELPRLYSFRLYLIGMFYDLFLPAGIGGDGFNAYLINKQFGVEIKPILRATWLDRISGSMSLLFLAGVGYLALGQPFLSSWIHYVVVAVLFIIIPLYSFIIGKYFYSFHESFWITNFHSLTVNLMQLMSVYFIFRAIGFQDQILTFQVLFLLSSFVASPFISIGGVGLREFIFVLGCQYFELNANTAVAFCFIYFLIILVTSMIGGFMRVKSKSTISSRPSNSRK